VHQPDYSRAARVVEETMGAHQPEVWISDRYSAQQKHGAAHQTCLAHLARDTAFALEHGSDDLPLRFKLWFGKAFDLAADIADFASATIASKKRVLEINSPPFSARRRNATWRANFKPKSDARETSFSPSATIPARSTHQYGSERKLRPCVIQRKVTNGYRAMWAAQAEADVRTTVDTQGSRAKPLPDHPRNRRLTTAKIHALKMRVGNTLRLRRNRLGVYLSASSVSMMLTFASMSSRVTLDTVLGSWKRSTRPAGRGQRGRPG